MEINFSKFKKLIPKVSFSFSINPHKHWNILLIVSSVIITVLILFSIFLSIKIKNKDIFKVNISREDTSILINDKLLKEMNNYFYQKEMRLNNN